MTTKKPNNLRMARTAQGLTQRQVSKMLDIDQSVYSGYEQGRHIPQLALALRIAKMYGSSVERLWPEL